MREVNSDPDVREMDLRYQARYRRWAYGFAPYVFNQEIYKDTAIYYSDMETGEPRGSRRAGAGRGGDGGGGGGGGLHAEQHFEIHRPIRPGDILTGTTGPGTTWEKEGKRSGKLVFSESITEYRDQDGELVVTARGVSVRTERAVSTDAPKEAG